MTHETKTLARINTLLDLRKGKMNVIIGVNLQGKGIDLPEVSLVCIVDADIEGLFRNYNFPYSKLLVEVRNQNGRVIMYADHVVMRCNKPSQKPIVDILFKKNYNRMHNIVLKLLLSRLMNR